MTIEEIHARFDSEWVLIGDPRPDGELNVQSGRVLAHSRDRDEVYRQAVALKPARFAVLFIGSIPDDAAIVL